MQVLVIVTTLVFALSVIMSSAESLRTMIQALEVQELERQVDEYGRRMSAWRDRFGVVPGQLDDLQLPGDTDPSGEIVFQRAGSVTDGTWLFDRAIIWKWDPLDPFTDPNNIAGNLLAASANRCGAASFGSAPTFCASQVVPHFKVESREVAENVAAARLSIHRTLEKIASYVWVDGTFPDKDRAGDPLSPGSTTPLATLVGYAGTAEDCDGIFMWMSVPYGCEDIFVAPFGSPVMYVYDSANLVGIFTETGLRRANGESVIVGENLVQ